MRRNRIRRHVPFTAGLLLAALLFSGCSSTSFIGGRFDDFTAFYNTFYNARKSFDKGEKGVLERTGPVDRQIYRPIFPVYETAAPSRDFEDAIRKSADVLRDHGTSKWVDDALLLIGKSYFYQQNYYAAEEKFNEVIALETGLQDEARYWLARTLLSANSYEELNDLLVVTFERERLSKKWAGYLRLVQGELYVRTGLKDDAIGPLSQGAKSVKQKRLSTRASYLLGQILESLGNYDEAITAYKRSLRKNSDFDLVYAAQVSIIRAEAANGDVETALKDLRKMERDDKNFQSMADLRAVRGRILAEHGRIDEAENVFHDVLRSDDRITPEVKGEIHYRLATIYRDVDSDFMLAAAHFDTAATSLQSLIDKRNSDAQKFGFSEPFVPWAIRDAREEKDVFGTFAREATDVAEMDSLLYLGSLDEAAFEERLAEIRKQRREELAELARQRQEQQIETQFRGGAAAAADRQQDLLAQKTGGSGAATATGAESGFLYHKDPALVQEGLRNFVQRWGERPPVPGWRLSSKLIAAASAAKASGEPDKNLLAAKQAAGNLLGTDSFGAEFDDLDISQIPRTETAREGMRTKRAEARYRVGTVLFLAMDRPDSAAAWFRTVITEDPDEPIAPNAYYALAEVNRALGDEGRADELMRALAEKYPEERKAFIVQDEVADDTDQEGIEERYADLYDQWQAGSFRDAAGGLVALAHDADPTARNGAATIGQPTNGQPTNGAASKGPAANVPGSDVDDAAKALFAAGNVLIDWATTDGRSTDEPVELAMTDSTAIWLGVAKVDSAATRPVLPEDVAAPADSNVVSGQSSAAPDSVQAQTASAVMDTTAVPEVRDIPERSAEAENGLPADSLGSTVVAGTDSTMSAAGTVLPDGMSLVGVSPEAILSAVSSKFGRTDYAAAAAKQLEAVKEIRARKKAVRDSLAAVEAARLDSIRAANPVPAADSLGVAANAAPDSVLAGGLPDGPPAPDTTGTEAVKQPPTPSPNEMRRDAAARVNADSVYAADTVDIPPYPIGGGAALRSLIALPDTVTAGGIVEVAFLVDKNGVTSDPEIVSGVAPIVDDACLTAVRQMRYTPGRQAGVPVAVRMSVRIPVGEE
ncbi:MAG: tetratricopeptide repeat protein [Bacteroidetes bacterium]|nr:tetratricopeptide repeat protein [Bacteroidota bacterium]